MKSNVKRMDTVCGNCIYFYPVSKCSENEITLFEMNPCGQCKAFKGKRLDFKFVRGLDPACDKFKG